MQTLRFCEQALPYQLVKDELDLSCDQPQIFADLVCGPIASTDTPMIAGASRALMYGGGHLRVRYNAAVFASNQVPCSRSLKVVTALVVLPLLEDDLTPAYLPNLAISRSQLSIVHATQSDNDENILFWHDEQLDLTNICCNGSDPPGNAQCAILTDAACNCGSSNVPFGFFVAGHAGALYGRFTIEHQVRVKRRLKEREALFLLTEYVDGGLPSSVGNVPTWLIRRNTYHRYAVRPSR